MTKGPHLIGAGPSSYEVYFTIFLWLYSTVIVFAKK